MSTMRSAVRRRFAWWTLPAALLLWGLVLWTVGLVQLWDSAAGRPRLQVADAPGTIWGTLAAVLALVLFGDHLRRARGLSR
jgi:hypothetical protein